MQGRVKCETEEQPVISSAPYLFADGVFKVEVSVRLGERQVGSHLYILRQSPLDSERLGLREDLCRRDAVGLAACCRSHSQLAQCFAQEAPGPGSLRLPLPEQSMTTRCRLPMFPLVLTFMNSAGFQLRIVSCQALSGKVTTISKRPRLALVQAPGACRSVQGGHTSDLLGASPATAGAR